MADDKNDDFDDEFYGDDFNDLDDLDLEDDDSLDVASLDDLENEDIVVVDADSADDNIIITEHDILDGDSEDDNGSDDDMPILPPQKKSFVQKFFLPIVIFVVAIMGVLWLLTQSMVAPPPAIPRALDGMPPAPTPIDSTNITEDTGAFSQNVSDPAAVLTPIPEPQTLDTIELADLNADSIENPALTFEGEEFEGPALNSEEIDVDVNITSDPLDTLNDPSFLPVDDTDETSANTRADVTGNTDDPIFIMNDNENLNTTSADEDIIDFSGLGDDKNIDNPSDAINNIPEAIIEGKVEKRVETITTEMQKKEAALLEQIESLKSTVNSLNEKIESLPNENVSNTPAASQPARQENTIKKPEAVVKPKPAKRVPQWSLRSAKPGLAVVRSDLSGDLRTVEVGDTLDGVGKISSINYKSGVWTIQGSRGAITR